MTKTKIVALLSIVAMLAALPVTVALAQGTALSGHRLGHVGR